MSSEPLFSIVIPTRNRAVLLRHALTTALAQHHGDFEVVVCDNHSSDQTASVVAVLRDERVRYVRAGRALPAHESWERAVSEARGEWVTLLPDDDGIVPSLLSRLERILAYDDARAISWGDAWYVHPEAPPAWKEPEAVNRLTVDPCTGRLEDVDCRAALRRLYATGRSRPVPGLVGSAVHRSTLERVRQVAGAVFLPPDPFVAAALGVMTLEPRYLFVDLPLSVRGFADATISAAFAHGTRGAHPVVDEFERDESFTEVPLRTATATNIVAESLLRAKRHLRGLLDDVDFDLAGYFVRCHDELLSRAVPDRAARDEWRAALRRQPVSVQVRTLATIAGRRLGRVGREAARHLPLARRLRRAVRTHVEHRSQLLLVHGDECGFSDLAGAARYLDDEVLPRLERQREAGSVVASATEPEAAVRR